MWIFGEQKLSRSAWAFVVLITLTVLAFGAATLIAWPALQYIASSIFN